MYGLIPCYDHPVIVKHTLYPFFLKCFMCVEEFIKHYLLFSSFLLYSNVRTNTSFCHLFPHETVSVYVKQLYKFPYWILLGSSKFDRAFLMCETAVLSRKVIFHSECWRQKCSDFLVALNASKTMDRLGTVAFHCICFSSFSVWI